MGYLPKLVYVYDKTLGPTVDPSGLQGPPGSSLHQSVTQVKSSSRGFIGSFAGNTVIKKSYVKY